jgi:hypothetical protein
MLSFMMVVAGCIAFITHTQTHTHTQRAYLETNHHMHSCLSHFHFTIVHWRQNFRVLYFFCFCRINLVTEFHKTELWRVVVWNYILF